MILRLAYRSLLARALTVGMTILAIALSVAPFLGAEKVRPGARSRAGLLLLLTGNIPGERACGPRGQSPPRPQPPKTRAKIVSTCLV